MSHAGDPALQYQDLKDLCLETPVVRDGGPMAALVVPAGGDYDELARRIQAVIRELTDVEIPCVDDRAPEAAVPLVENVILLGNRTTHRTIGELYNRHYCLLDLRYPGPGGHVLRSLHCPFGAGPSGNGRNAILVGGSDGEGVAAATEILCKRLAEAGAEMGAPTSGGGPVDLSLGWLMDIALGEGMELPDELRDYEIWEASAGYGSVGYFGWNSLSKRLAAYYMTGDTEQARQFLRLAFPGDEAKAEIADLDGERVENKDEPLSGPYHYNAHMMILFWDLVEESPVFSDDDRLRVTNAFARQFFHAEDRAYRRMILENSKSGTWPYGEAPPFVGSRHGQWSAISLYCLCRYFHRDYPAPLWEHGMAAAQQHFASLGKHAWVGGENDNLFWYCTGVAPILSYLLLTGERQPLKNGILRDLLAGLDMLVSGRVPDWALHSASVGFLHKAAYLTGDGRFLEYARRTGVDRDILRLGQSYWPSKEQQNRRPDELSGRWSIHPVPEPMWQTREAGLPHDESFLFGSYRSAADESGDFLLIKGLNGASRNPYHTFAILEARLDGQTVLAGFTNQVRVTVGGTVEPRVAMDAALRHRMTVGQAAAVTAEVPHAPFCGWTRTALLQVGQCLAVADRLRFRHAADEAEVELWWEGEEVWQEITADGSLVAAGGSRGQVRLCDALPTEVLGVRARMVWRGPVEDGQELVFLSLVGLSDKGELSCRRLCPVAASLHRPEPALMVCGEYEGMRAELLLLGRDRISGAGVSHLALPDSAGIRSGGGQSRILLESDVPADVDWDLAAGELHIGVASVARLQLAASDGDPSDAPRILELAAGQHHLSDAHIADAARDSITACLARADDGEGRGTGSVPAESRAPARDEPPQEGDARAEACPSGAPHVPVDQPALPSLYRLDLGGAITGLSHVSSASGDWLAAATGSAIHLLDANGAVARVLATDGPIRVVHWWPETGLLLAGCVDEQVIAFDPATGERAWVFTSEMDAAVWRAAKTYWFKSQPGHEGIHGLHSGAFLDRIDAHGAHGTQAFAGSACTLEILDSSGHLLERLPVFWGPGTQFRLIEGPTGAPRLLLAREPTDSHALAVIDRDDLDGTPRGFSGVPEGHANIGGWACMSRDHIFYADVDGDGQPEVISEINGTWNRITVWAADGTPKANLQLGPGDVIPARNVRDLELLDLNGDGRPEIVAALSSGLVLAADGQCEPLWSRRLPSPPVVLAGGRGEAGVLAACEDGSALLLDGSGAVVAGAAIGGRSRCVAAVPGGVALGTEGGQITAIGTGG